MTEQRPVIAAPFHRHVVIAGAGLSGAALAWHLARLTESEAHDSLAITLVDPRAEPGRGLAYSTADPDHRLNVPHVRMTLDTSEPNHYADWLASGAAPEFSSDAILPDGAIYTPRAVFGAYVEAHLRPFLATGRISFIQGRATSASRIPGGWELGLEDGRELTASELVLAATHPGSALPRGLEKLNGSDLLVVDPYAAGALDCIGPEEAVLIIGSGLTGADIVATLSRRRHRGKIAMLSRSGRRSQPHGPSQPETTADFTVTPARTARALLRRIRVELAQAAQQGLTWHPVFDRLRSQGPQIWAELPIVERRRLVRHLRGLWDIHRFRIAPQTHASLTEAEAEGRVIAYAGRIQRLEQSGRDGQRLQILVRLKVGGEASLTADRVILATGPAHGAVTATNPLYADLARQGLIRVDPLGLGLDATTGGEAISADNRAQPDLLIAGPLARAAVGELMGVPEVTAWAEKLARQLAHAPAIA